MTGHDLASQPMLARFEDAIGPEKLLLSSSAAC